MRVEVTLPSELLDWIDNHGKGLMREDMSVSSPDIQLIYILVNLQDTTPAIGSSSELQTPVVTIPSPSDSASTSNTASDIPSTVPPTPTATSTSPSSIQSINTAIDPVSSQSCRFATAGLNMSSFFSLLLSISPSFFLSFSNIILQRGSRLLQALEKKDLRMVKVRKPLSSGHMEYASINVTDVCTCVIHRTMQSEE